MAVTAGMVALLPAVANAQFIGHGPWDAIERSIGMTIPAQVHTPYPFPILPLPDRRPEPPEIIAEWVGPSVAVEVEPEQVASIEVEPERVEIIEVEPEQVASAEVPQAQAPRLPRQPIIVPDERFELVRPSTLPLAPEPELIVTERPLTEPPALSRGLNISPALSEADVSNPQLGELQVAAEDIALLPGPGESIVQLPNSQGYRILFAAESVDLTSAAGSLLEGLALRMREDSSLWIQIRAFATDVAGRPSNSRSLSLNRALLVRSFLIDRGVRSTRVDIRALGNTAEGEPRDRVDLIFSN